MRTAADLDDNIQELVVEGRAAWMTREYERARQRFEQVLRLATEADDRFGQTAAYHFLGNISFNERKHSESREHHARALALARADGDWQGIGTSLASLALIEAAEQKVADARKLYEEAASAYEFAGMVDRASRLRVGADDLLSGRVTLDDGVHRAAT